MGRRSGRGASLLWHHQVGYAYAVPRCHRRDTVRGTRRRKRTSEPQRRRISLGVTLGMRR